MEIIGIVNITSDSFSDGGRYLDPEAALARADELIGGGATWIELGPASTHPDAGSVTATEEIARVQPVFDALRGRGVGLVLDSFVPVVQLHFARAGIHWLNDTRGFPTATVRRQLAGLDTRLVVMHSLDQSGYGTRRSSPADIVDHVRRYFVERIAALEADGVARERLIIDPGMGFFLGDDPAASFEMMARFGELRREFKLPVLLSVSRKSMLGALTGRATGERAGATLAAELACVLGGVDYLRTHDAAALADGVKVLRAVGLLDAPA